MLGWTRNQDKPQDLASANQWRAIARFEMGTDHISTQTPCQDYAEYKPYGNDYLIGAVSDGAGSRSLSHYGSKIAVETTIKFFTEKLETSRSKSFLSQDGVQIVFRELIEVIRHEIEIATQDYHREKGKKVGVGQFACTLLAFVAFPDGIAAMQLGDGFIVVRNYQGKDYDLLFEPSKGEYANETTFVTSSPTDIQQDLQITYKTNPVSFICASTDGLENLALNLRNNVAYPKFFIPLEKYIQETIEPEKDDYLIAYLNHETVNRKTGDDKTILLCVNVNADPVPEIKLDDTPVSKLPTSLPSSQTPPPLLGYPPSSATPSGKRAPKSSSADVITTQTSSPTQADSFTSTAPTSTKRTKIKNPPILIGLFLFSSFLCVYFATLAAYLLVEKVHQNHPELQITIEVLWSKATLGSIPIWVAAIFIIILTLWSIFSGLYATDNDINKGQKSKSTKEETIWRLIKGLKPNFGEVISVCLPIFALALAFLTSLHLNSVFPNVNQSIINNQIPKSTENKNNSGEKVKKPFVKLDFPKILSIEKK
ncbi:protein phosphatase 2C domain-containing protein [Pseudanabaena sp. FACHB-1277]|jgi:hypothetical protein|uniref:Protein phosphatase 2C domain-containing protein n=1 Tax=Pseudanabaena cinerea FACHB-1277 TaxID=2949581 RepID=A0A926Z988_9CYAN|nr:PP2C family serine/threonine-protein phosphatase [Pseudanabaena cinerea]MBD2151684.1 protein phosphatase 2C domain-containing protein [Pseudanabaena cinerea FACHB-1277]